MSAYQHINPVLLVNPKSANGKSLKVEAQIQAILEEKGVAFTKYIDWPDDLTGFNQAWIIGGDGTLNYFLNKYYPVPMPIAVFAAGSGNDFAWMIYGDISIEKQVAQVLDAKPKPVDLCRCNHFYFINTCGIGFDGEVLKSINSIRRVGSHLGYLLAVVKQIFLFREKQFEIRSEAITINQKYLLIIVSNSSRTGGGFMIAPHAKADDGLFNILLCKPLSILKRLRYLPLIEKGKHLDLDVITMLTGKSIEIKSSTTLPAQLDGELIYADTFSIQIIEGGMEFLY